MAHFAEIDENNLVLRVVVVDNKNTIDENGIEKEEIGIFFLNQLLGGIWKQTSYNANFRKHYAGIGYTFDDQRNAFIPPKPFNSWILNETTCNWEAPVAMPNDEQEYVWDENIQNWTLQNTI
jgi:hypothetical protein